MTCRNCHPEAFPLPITEDGMMLYDVAQHGPLPWLFFTCDGESVHHVRTAVIGPDGWITYLPKTNGRYTICEVCHTAVEEEVRHGYVRVGFGKESV